MGHSRTSAAVSMRDVSRAQVMVAHGVIRREHACDHKVAHPTMNDAKHAAKAVFRKTGRLAHPYHCEFCHQYHVTKLRHGEGDE